eukprot:289367_1
MDDVNGIETNELEPLIPKQSNNSIRNKGECSPPAKTDTTSVNIVTNDGSNHIIKDMAESIELSKLCASSAKASKLCASSAKASKLCASSAKAAKESLQFILYIYIGVFMMFNEFSVDQIVAQNMNFSYLLTGQY